MDVSPTSQEPIAIVGLACRVPGAEDSRMFWRNVRKGAVTITRHSREELHSAGTDSSVIKQPNFVPVGGYLPDASMFDAGFFGMSEREARITDPQHRMLMELTWEALEDAGYNPLTWPGRIGCFAGCGMTLYAGPRVGSYLTTNVLRDPELVAQVAVPQLSIGNLSDYLTTKLAYRFNFRGPALTVQTACSTGLAVVHVARSYLLQSECDLAVAGAAAVYTPLKKGYLADGGILSPEGACRPFDASASGTVGGSGGGVVLMRRLSAALRDGDSIRAVILGSSMNNDGSSKVSFTAPSFQGQCEVIERALRASGIDPATIGYVETHGTGTKMGDAVEIASLTETYRKFTGETGFCALGATKANIGHLDTAAGAIGLIKTILALEHREIPPLAGMEKPSSDLKLQDSPFFVPTRAQPWKPRGAVRRAAISSFGAGGTNVHLVLQEAPTTHRDRVPVIEPEIILLSARSPKALATLSVRYIDALKGAERLCLADIAFTTAVGRAHHAHRSAFVSTSIEDLAAQLERSRGDSNENLSSAPQPAHSQRVTSTTKVAFIFPGQGAFMPEVMAILSERYAAFRIKFDECAAVCAMFGLDLHGALSTARQSLDRASTTQPLLVAAQIALAELWKSWGVTAAAVTGHSLGEYAAAYVAGVFDVSSCMRLVMQRGALMDQYCPVGGMMIAVSVSAEVAQKAIHQLAVEDTVAVAAVNSEDSVVISGKATACQAVRHQLEESGARTLELAVTHAFHSPLMDEMLDHYRKVIQTTSFQQTSIPFYSTLTGRVASTFDENYWVHQIRRPVLFSAAVTSASADGYGAFLDLGIGPGLESLTRKAIGPQSIVISSIGRHSVERRLKEALAQLYVAGANLSWNDVYGERLYRRVHLPTYPFQRSEHWIEPSHRDASNPSTIAPLIMTTQWRCCLRPSSINRCYDDVLLISYKAPASISLRDSLIRHGFSVHCLQLACNSTDSFSRLADAIQTRGNVPHRIVLCLGSAERLLHRPGNLLSDVVDRVWLTTALIREVLERHPNGCPVTIVTDSKTGSSGVSDMSPEPAAMAVWATARVARRELPQWSIHLLDADLEESGAADKVCLELIDGQDEELCCRGSERLAPILEPTVLPSSAIDVSDQTVIITGGRSGLGLTLAQHLLSRNVRRLILVARSPSKENAPPLQTKPGQDIINLVADVASEDVVHTLLLELEKGGRGLDGVIHAAGVLDDCTVALQTRERIHLTCAPKIAGAVNMLQLAERVQAKWFVALSSAASLIGSPGQTSYAAANAAMAAFIRAHTGKIRASIAHMGPIEGGGMKLAHRAVQPQFAFQAVPTQVFLSFFDSLLAQAGCEVLAAMPREDGLLDQAARLDEFARAVWRADRTSPLTSTAAPALATATRSEPDLRSQIRCEVAALIGEPVTVIDVNRPFFDLGLDSLMIMTLRTRIMNVTGITVPIQAFFDSPTVTALSASIEHSSRLDSNDTGDAT